MAAEAAAASFCRLQISCGGRVEEQSGREGGSGAPAAAGDGFRNPTDSFQIPTLPFKNTQQKEGGREGVSVSGE